MTILTEQQRQAEIDLLKRLIADKEKEQAEVTYEDRPIVELGARLELTLYNGTQRVQSCIIGHRAGLVYNENAILHQYTRIILQWRMEYGDEAVELR